MKRQVLAVVMGSLIALPVFAAEIDNGNAPQPMASSKSTDQVRAELVQAQRAGNVVVDGEIGTLASQAATMTAGKSVAQVHAEVAQAYRSGAFNIDGELGTITNHL